MASLDTVVQPDHTALSWRDVYRAVAESEERIIAAVKDSVSPLRITTDDHEVRLRRLEFEGSAEAKEALRVATALGLRLDGLAVMVNANASVRRGILDTLSAGQKTILVVAAFVGMFAVLLDIISKYAGGP